MTDKIHLPLGPQPIQPAKPVRQPELVKSTGPDFEQVLQQAIAKPDVKFSAHAEKRLITRGIAFDAERLAQLSQAIDKVQAKGGRESLILMDELALIVSIKNRTVITAIDGENLRTNVFTNIDSAIIA
ncbi:MAG: hypothetical protein GX058_05395 [Firmicutes bacterium]|nr:hypothetical protein [Bacillota bacterium]